MKVVTSIFLTLIVILGLTAGLILTDPETTVETFFAAMKIGDAKTAAQCLENGMTPSEMVEFSAMAENPMLSDFNVTVTGSEIYGETALVYIEITSSDFSDTSALDLVNVNGSWLITYEIEGEVVE